MDRRARGVKLDPQKTSFAVDRDHTIHIRKRISQMLLNRLRRIDHPIIFYRLQRSQNGSHCDHPATESCTEIVFFDRKRNVLVNQTRADRNAAAQTLCERYNIRLNVISKIAASKKPVSRSADAGLNLVKNQHRTEFITNIAKLSKKFRFCFSNARHRLDRFENYPCGLFVKHRPHGFYISKFGFDMIRDVRLAYFAISTQKRCRY